MAPRAVLLDIDGTLVDSTYFHAVAWWRACRAAGELIPMAQLHRLVGMGSDMLTETLFGRARPQLGEAEGEQYRPFMEELTALPGASELVRRISEVDLRPILASSSRERDIPRLLEVVGADDDIDAVTSAADAERSKPHPDIFQAALSKSGVSAADSLAIGDTRWDVEAAAKLGIRCIGFLSGGWSEAELRSAGAIEVYQHPQDLLDRFETSAVARLAGE